MLSVLLIRDPAQVLDRHAGVTAVHNRFGASHERTRVAGQQDRRADQFARFAESLHWSVTHDLIDSFRSEYLLILFGWEEAGHERVHADVQRSPFAGKVGR